MPATRCACIDVGSNTTALLVADISRGELSVVGTRRVFTLLGAGHGPSGIPEEKIAEVVIAVLELLEYAAELDCAHIELVATHVVREAHNGHELERRVAEATGRTLRVIDGHQEARYAFIGAIGGLDRVRRPTLVIDAGGGSTEVSQCVPGGDPVTASFALGSASLTHEFLASDPPRADELARARARAEQLIATLEIAQTPAVALAVGGGASTAQQLTGGLLDRGGIARVLALATSLTSLEIAERFSIAQNRARLLPAALTILDVFVELIGVELEVGRGGLREGVLLDRYA